MPFKGTNKALGLALGAAFQVGINDEDSATPVIEQGVLLPWPSDPASSWVYYDCAVGVMLDSGIVVHNRLPQVNRAADTLAACLIDDPNMPAIMVGGVNLSCQDQYQDIVQRMGHARYWFRLWGQALRIGYQVPIPSLKSIGGVPAVPYDRNPQWAYNAIAPGGNFSGAIMWRAQWSLWYTTAVPPVGGSQFSVPAVDPAAIIDGKVPPPAAMQGPYSIPDDDALPTAPKPIVKPVVNPKGG